LDILLEQLELGIPFFYSDLRFRQVATGLAHLRRTKQKTLVTSMCIGILPHMSTLIPGTGMGAAALFINEAN
jgi:hypothetical protein